MKKVTKVTKVTFLAHLVYKPKEPYTPYTCIVCHQHWNRRHHLCTPPPTTGLDIETSYLEYLCTYVPHYAHQRFSDSDMEFLNGSNFGTFL